MTVREAFALAGHPVPEGCEIYHSHYGWTYQRPGDKAVFGFYKRGEWGIYGVEPQKHAAASPIALTRLPASDCLEALPKIVRAALPPPTEQTVAEEGMREALEKAKIDLTARHRRDITDQDEDGCGGCQTCLETLPAISKALSNKNAVGPVQGQDVEPIWEGEMVGFEENGIRLSSPTTYNADKFKKRIGQWALYRIAVSICKEEEEPITTPDPQGSQGEG